MDSPPEKIQMEGQMATYTEATQQVGDALCEFREKVTD